MQQPPPNAMNSSISSTPLNLVTTEQIQKHLDDNRKLIVAIMQCQQSGNVTYAAQLQALLQNNLLYLAAVADAQNPQPTTVSSQIHLPASSIPQQQCTNIPAKTEAMVVPHQGVPVTKLTFQFNASQRQEQHGQILQLQQPHQMNTQYSVGVGSNNGLQLFMEPAGGSGSSESPMEIMGKQASRLMEANSGFWQGQLGSGSQDQARQ